MAAAAKARTVDPIVTWCFDSATGRHEGTPVWLPFARIIQTELERSYQNQERTKFFRAGAHKYSVDFDSMERTDLETGRKSQVYRDDPTGARPPPKRPQPSKSAVTHDFKAGAKIDWQAITCWRRLKFGEYDPEERDLMDEPLGDGIDDPVVELSCSTDAMRCVFRQSFVERALDSQPACCSCGYKYATPGGQPSGTMRIRRTADPCQGFEGYGSIVIEYDFPNGIQHERMSNPGMPYAGTQRRAFLPDNESIGARCLALLEKAFQLGRTFRIGTSVTTGATDTTVWGGIHHKTRQTGGAEKHGWPDPTFVDRLISECAAEGIMEDTTSKDSPDEMALDEVASDLVDEAPPPQWTPRFKPASKSFIQVSYM